MKTFKQHLTELSKKTLGSYVKKASADAVDTGKRYATIHTDSHFRAPPKDAERLENKFYNKSKSRLKGVAKATNKLTKEETLDEAPIGSVKKGQMHKDLDKSPDAKITSKDIAKEKAKGGVYAKRAVFAQNAKKWHHEETELGEHYTDEGNNPHDPLVVIHSTTQKKIDGREPMLGHMHLTTAAKVYRISHMDALKNLRQHGEHVSTRSDGEGHRVSISRHQKVWEETEQVDEVSKAMLSRYRDAADTDSHKQLHKGNFGKAVKRSDDSSKRGMAYKKITGKDVKVPATEETLVDQSDTAYFSREIEPIDELSKKTLGRYIQGASRDRADIGLKQGIDMTKTGQAGLDADSAHMEKDQKRAHGIRHALKRLTKEETLDETESYNSKGAKLLQKVMAKSRARNPNTPVFVDEPKKKEKPFRDAAVTGKARDFANEETEVLDEISQKTKKSYIKKATKEYNDLPTTASPSDFLKGHGNWGLREPEFRKAMKRAKGIKLAKEETIIEKYEGMEHMSDAAHELVAHADNSAQLHHGSHMPIINNLKKKMKKGVYDSEKAKKLWHYHADRAAQSYHKEYGDKSVPWHKMFTTADRKQAAAHWEHHHKDELNESVEQIDEIKKVNLHPKRKWMDVEVLSSSNPKVKKERKSTYKSLNKKMTLSQRKKYAP